MKKRMPKYNGRHRWMPFEDEIIRKGFAEGWPDEAIQRQLPHRTLTAVEQRRSQGLGLTRSNMPPRRAGSVRHYTGGLNITGDPRPATPAAALIERDRAYNAPRTLGMELLGEPLPGRGYLDRMKQGDAR